ncbi:MAG: NrdH-redoxin [Nocardioides sp.]|nr:NrdH-redoxin [Nocardioides sp.]
MPLIYWRPGCTFCVRLQLVLGLAGRRAVWVNVRRDPAAAAGVRSVNNGKVTVPTVFVGEVHRTNLAPAWVRERLTVIGGGDPPPPLD